MLLLTCDSRAVCTGFRLHVSHTVKPSTVERRHPVELVVAFSRDTPVAWQTMNNHASFHWLDESTPKERDVHTHPPPPFVALVTVLWYGVQIVNETPAHVVDDLIEDGWCRCISRARGRASCAFVAS